jgi:hypothetical protein
MLIQLNNALDQVQLEMRCPIEFMHLEELHNEKSLGLTQLTHLRGGAVTPFKHG